MFGHAQTSEDQVAAQHATSAFRREDRGPDGRRGQGVYSSPDGNFAVLDLGESERYSVKGHSHAVYDFAAKKVFIVRFVPSTNSIYVDSETLR